MAVYDIVKDGFLAQHLPTVREIYRTQCGYMLDALAARVPGRRAPGRGPKAACSSWVTLPEAHRQRSNCWARPSRRTWPSCRAQPFYAGKPAPRNTLRLCFVTVPEDKIRSGVATLGTPDQGATGLSRPMSARSTPARPHRPERHRVRPIGSSAGCPGRGGPTRACAAWTAPSAPG